MNQPLTPSTQPRLQASSHAPDAALLLLGRWTAGQLTDADAWTAMNKSLKATTPSANTAWDLRTADALDHIGAQILWNHWGRAWPAQLQMHPSQRAVLERVAQFSLAAVPANSLSLAQRFNKLGEVVFIVAEHVRGMTELIGQLFLDLLRLARAPRQGPWRDVSGHLYNIGATALPITALVGMLIGVVLAYLMAQQLRQFGADSFIVDILGVSLIRELGPMLAAILLAGRSGSAITAQIGVMRVTEELDAMRVMGISHGFRLVMPRAIALAIAMPLIAVWTTTAALLGGMIAADLALDISANYFLHALPGAVDKVNLTLSVAKSSVFGVLIALVGCHYGLRVKPNTESLGRGTTASVVTAITIVILVDAAFAIVFKDLGV